MLILTKGVLVYDAFYFVVQIDQVLIQPVTTSKVFIRAPKFNRHARLKLCQIRKRSCWFFLAAAALLFHLTAKILTSNLSYHLVPSYREVQVSSSRRGNLTIAKR
jgi:hypothetical protein